MAIDVAQKAKTGDDQPNGGEGIVGVAGAKGLTAANKIDSNHSVSAGKSASLIDQPIDLMYTNLKDRFDDYNTYSA
ncbi:MAG: hypothetical protein CMI54_07465 [Parcubacteria group bacterium]|jgi:hypothetical protein|nr:hypothetical protein [Parcubacteria group bacterium]|tara:strand:+ start:5526 stop:5753 length:228 start_codon:yes stop_codon:yes gene_type:complete